MKNQKLTNELKKLNSEIETTHKDIFKLDQKISSLEERKAAAGVRLMNSFGNEKKYASEVEKAKAIHDEISTVVEERKKLVSNITKLKNRIDDVTKVYDQSEALSAVFSDDFFSPDELKALCIILRENHIRTAKELSAHITSTGAL